jgi:hypothetical protein
VELEDLPTSSANLLAVPAASATYRRFESAGSGITARILEGMRIGLPCLFADFLAFRADSARESLGEMSRLSAGAAGYSRCLEKVVWVC